MWFYLFLCRSARAAVMAMAVQQQHEPIRQRQLQQHDKHERTNWVPTIATTIIPIRANGNQQHNKSNIEEVKKKRLVCGVYGLEESRERKDEAADAAEERRETAPPDVADQMVCTASITLLISTNRSCMLLMVAEISEVRFETFLRTLNKPTPQIIIHTNCNTTIHISRNSIRSSRCTINSDDIFFVCVYVCMESTGQLVNSPTDGYRPPANK
jgi:hypothetical protein